MKNNDKLILKEVSKITSDEFTKQGFSSVITKEDFTNLEELREYLSEKVVTLMDRDYDKFLNILYLIDIPQEKFNAVFKENKAEDVPIKIADLIIERQLQKLYFRRKYKQGEF